MRYKSLSKVSYVIILIAVISLSVYFIRTCDKSNTNFIEEPGTTDCQPKIEYIKEKPTEKEIVGTTKNEKPKVGEHEAFEKYGDKRMVMFTIQKTTSEQVFSEWVMNYVFEGATDFIVITDVDGTHPTVHKKVKKLLKDNNIRLEFIRLEDTEGKHEDHASKYNHEYCFKYLPRKDGSHFGYCQKYIVDFVHFKLNRERKKDPNTFVCFVDVDEYIQLDVRQGVNYAKRNLKTFLFERGYEVYWIDGILYGLNNRMFVDDKLTVQNSYLYHSDFIDYHHSHYAFKSCYKQSANIKGEYVHQTLSHPGVKTLMITRMGPYWNDQRLLFDHYKYLNIGEKAKLKGNLERLIKKVTHKWDICACLNNMRRMEQMATFFNKKVSIPSDVKKCLWCNAQIYMDYKTKYYQEVKYDLYDNGETIHVQSITQYVT
mmetsp:Transcript_2169/g.3136  ORF Transcript_2169/g.3136 Transcript_2169/m.3136 type:complete len:428 (+) Transcript_2169:52-1335(+)